MPELFENSKLNPKGLVTKMAGMYKNPINERRADHLIYLEKWCHLTEGCQTQLFCHSWARALPTNFASHMKQSSKRSIKTPLNSWKKMKSSQAPEWKKKLAEITRQLWTPGYIYIPKDKWVPLFRLIIFQTSAITYELSKHINPLSSMWTHKFSLVKISILK